MIKIKKYPTKGFTQFSNLLINDDEISYKAKGIFLYLWSKPDGWTVRIKDLIKKTEGVREGRDTIYAGLKELELGGYLSKYNIHENGKIKKIDYRLCDSGNIDDNVDVESVESLLPAKPDTVKPDTVNPPYSKERIVNKERINSKSQKLYFEDKVKVAAYETYSEFYRNEILKALEADNRWYEIVVEILYGKNEMDQKLTQVLSLRDQLTFKQFLSLEEFKKDNPFKYSTMFAAMENYKNLSKNSLSLSATLQNWVGRDKKR